MVQRIWSYYSAPWRRYLDFDGRSTRREFWTFYIGNALVYLLANALDAGLGLVKEFGQDGPISLLFLLASLVPLIAVAVRRLHDGARSGAWVLSYLIPLVGWIIALVQLLAGGTVGPNRFGDDPRRRPTPDIAFPDDGGPPYATPKGRFVRCPWCDRTNPLGLTHCQWCHEPYRERWQAATPA